MIFKSLILLIFLSSTTYTCKALANRPRSDHTANIRTIFKRDKEYVNPETGVIEDEDGHWCTLCQSALFSFYVLLSSYI